MAFSFEKYQGTGNDFVMVDNRKQVLDRKNLAVRKICDRRFGIGADGLILIENHDEYDFEMVYFNSDGTQSFCGNGSRCAVAFAKKIGAIGANEETHFLSTDGAHTAQIYSEGVSLQMHNVNKIETIGADLFINTGSPHYLIENTDLQNLDILTEAHKIRYNHQYKAEGVNVNFVHPLTPEHIQIRTYERGVEGETYSCGTGVTAAALGHAFKQKLPNGDYEIKIETKGGELRVSFTKTGEQSFENIFLKGPATFVFNGQF